MKWAVFITARLKSKRLRKKILKYIDKNFTVIEFLVKNLEKLKLDIYVITSTNKGDDELCQFLKLKNIKYYRGEPLDVIKRIYDCSKKIAVSNIVSVTADNPFIDTSVLKQMIKTHNNKNNDFTMSQGLPLGLFGYCLKTKILKEILKKKKRKNTEFWGGYILKDKSFISKIVNLKGYKSLIKYRFTIDYYEDLIFCRKVLNLFVKKYSSSSIISAKKLMKINLKDISKINNYRKQISGPLKYI